MLPDSDDFNFGLEVSDFVVSCIGGGFLGGYMLYNNININYIYLTVTFNSCSSSYIYAVNRHYIHCTLIPVVFGSLVLSF